MTTTQVFSWYIVHQLALLPCHDVVRDRPTFGLLLNRDVVHDHLGLNPFLIMLLPLTTVDFFFCDVWQ